MGVGDADSSCSGPGGRLEGRGLGDVAVAVAGGDGVCGALLRSGCLRSSGRGLEPCDLSAPSGERGAEESTGLGPDEAVLSG